MNLLCLDSVLYISIQRKMMKNSSEDCASWHIFTDRSTTSAHCYRVKSFVLPVDPTAHTATGVMHESQSLGVNKLLLHTAPLLFTQTSQEDGSEPGYDDVEHSNSVIWCTNGFLLLLHIPWQTKKNMTGMIEINYCLLTKLICIVCVCMRCTYVSFDNSAS